MINVGDTFPSLVSIIHINIRIAPRFDKAYLVLIFDSVIDPVSPVEFTVIFQFFRQENQGTVNKKIFECLWHASHVAGTALHAKGTTIKKADATLILIVYCLVWGIDKQIIMPTNVKFQLNVIYSSIYSIKRLCNSWILKTCQVF